MTGMWFIPFLLTHTYIKVAHQHASAIRSSSQLPSLGLIKTFWAVSFLCRVMTCLFLFIPMMQTYGSPQQAYHKSDLLNMMYHLSVVTHTIMFAGARTARAILPALSASIGLLQEQAHINPLAASKANAFMQLHKATSHIIKGFIKYNVVSVIRELFFACWPYLRAKGTWYVTSFYMIVMITAITTFVNLDESMLSEMSSGAPVSTLTYPRCLRSPHTPHYQITPATPKSPNRALTSSGQDRDGTQSHSVSLFQLQLLELQPCNRNRNRFYFSMLIRIVVRISIRDMSSSDWIHHVLIIRCQIPHRPGVAREMYYHHPAPPLGPKHAYHAEPEPESGRKSKLEPTHRGREPPSDMHIYVDPLAVGVG